MQRHNIIIVLSRHLYFNFKHKIYKLIFTQYILIALSILECTVVVHKYFQLYLPNELLFLRSLFDT